MNYTYNPKPVKYYDAWAIDGTMYGKLHTTNGDIRTWKTYSGAYKAAMRYRAMYAGYFL